MIIGTALFRGTYESNETSENERVGKAGNYRTEAGSCYGNQFQSGWWLRSCIILDRPARRGRSARSYPAKSGRCLRARPRPSPSGLAAEGILSCIEAVKVVIVATLRQKERRAFTYRVYSIMSRISDFLDMIILFEVEKIEVPRY